MAPVSDKLSLYKFFGLSSVLSSSVDYLMWFGLVQNPTGLGAKECKVTFINKFSYKPKVVPHSWYVENSLSFCIHVQIDISLTYNRSECPPTVFTEVFGPALNL